MKKDSKKEVAVVEKNSPVAVDNFITQAISQNVPVETMERLFALRKEVKAEQAKEAYVDAVARFQSECPVIKKSKKVMNKDGRTVRYMFAPLDSIVEQIKKPLSTANLSYRWETKQENGNVTAICTITHMLGHSESSDFMVPVDTEGYMTQPQKFASALTFAKRYSLCNALGISTGDEDTDATDVKKDKGVKSEKSKIIFLLRTLGRDSKDKVVIEKTVKELTQLDLKEENFGEIVERLEVLVREKQEYDHENNEIR